MKRLLGIVLFLSVTLAACGQATPAAPANPTAAPTQAAPTATTAPAATVAPANPTAAPAQAAPTATTAPAATVSVQPTAAPIATAPAAQATPFELARFVDTWNSGNVAAIRAMYTDDAMLYSEKEGDAMSDGQSVDASVGGAALQAHVLAHQGLRLRIVGRPIVVYDKLVAFHYRWESGDRGYSGAALLRLEHRQVYLHAYVEDSALTADPGDPRPAAVSLDPLLAAWNSGTSAAAEPFYAQGAVILSDEDLARAPWRDHMLPAALTNLLPQFAGWRPTTLETPTQVGSLVLAEWRWASYFYPTGYGVRLLRYEGNAIATDIRFAIRPWEGAGNTFLEDF